MSSATLVLVATALYQNQGSQQSPLPQLANSQQSTATYEKYVSALKLLESHQPVAALELLSACSRVEARATNRLTREQALPHSSGMLFLHLGTRLSQHAAQAAQSGSFKQARLLREACLSLSQQLAQSGYAEEDATDRFQRLQVTEFLRRQAYPAQSEFAPVQIS
jgi:hypothetical protein